jgi:hypothetical protein
VAKPDDWQILAVTLLRRLGCKVELGMDELADARERLDPDEYETFIVTYRASQLESEKLTVELRCRSREILAGELLKAQAPDSQ